AAGSQQALLGRLVVGIELRCPCIGFRRFGHVAAPLVDERLIGPAFRDFFVEADCRVEIGECVLLVSQRQIGYAAPVIAIGLIGLGRDRNRNILYSKLMLPRRLVRKDAEMVEARIRRIKLLYLVEILECFVFSTFAPLVFTAARIVCS